MSEQKRFYRSQSERMLGGVCGGLAQYFNADPALVRLIFVALAFFKGLGILAYLVAWIIMPEEPVGEPSGRDTARADK